jgi:hypothetical protein
MHNIFYSLSRDPIIIIKKNNNGITIILIIINIIKTVKTLWLTYANT